MKLSLKPGFETKNIDLSSAPWDRYGKVEWDDLSDWPALVNNRENRLHDVFDMVEPDEQSIADALIMNGNCSNVHGIGVGLQQGTITVEGNAGNRLGESMSGGHIFVHGDCRDNVGRGMKGGRVSIQGNAGDHLGSALPGAKWGMNGGEIFVLGNAGNGVGELMRRGLIAVAGKVGECTAQDMKAGTIVLGQPPLTPVGLGLRRGTVLIYDSGESFSPGLAFENSCDASPVFISLILKQLEKAGFVEDASLKLNYTRYCGDRLELNRGEMFVTQSRLKTASTFPTPA